MSAVLRLPRIADATLYATYRALLPLIVAIIAVRIVLRRTVNENAERRVLVVLVGGLVAAFFGLRRTLADALGPLSKALVAAVRAQPVARPLDNVLKSVLAGENDENTDENADDEGENDDENDDAVRTVEDVALRVALRRARLYRTALARYTVSSTVAALDAMAPLATATQRFAAVLFCDLKGFTALSERAPPATVLRLLAAFFEVVCAEVENHGGQVGSFLGDGALCIWEANENTENNDENDNENGKTQQNRDMFGQPAGEAARCAINGACEAAFGILERLSENADEDVRTLDCRFGINAGNCLVGVFGCGRRLSYTAIADTVNVASRVETATRLLGCRVLVHGACVQYVGPAFRCRFAGVVEAKGKRCRLPLYEVLPATPSHRRLIDLTARLHALLDAGELPACLRLALRARRAFPDDDVLRAALARCLTALQTPLIAPPF